MVPPRIASISADRESFAVLPLPVARLGAGVVTSAGISGGGAGGDGGGARTVFWADEVTGAAMFGSKSPK